MTFSLYALEYSRKSDTEYQKKKQLFLDSAIFCAIWDLIIT